MNIDQALHAADESEEAGLRGLYPTAAQVLANEVRNLRAKIYLAVIEERNACVGICYKYSGRDGDNIAEEIELRNNLAG